MEKCSRHERLFDRTGKDMGMDGRTVQKREINVANLRHEDDRKSREAVLLVGN